MSRETLEWLAENVVTGFVKQRGPAWWNNSGTRGTNSLGEPNHYDGPVPIDRVERLLPEVESLPSYVLLPNGEYRVVPEQQHIVRKDNHLVLGTFSDGYVIHQYRDWLLKTVANILDDTLQIGSAGLLRGGRIAWVQVEVPENITTPEGVVFRPNLLATTSHDGSLSSTFKRTVTNVVCDNTHRIALSEDGQEVRVRHSRYSEFRLSDVREALAIVHSTVDDFEAEVAELCSTKVSNAEWKKFLDAHTPIPEEAGRGKTLAETKRLRLQDLWATDERVSPWKNTAWGVVQAVNTYEHWVKPTRGAEGGKVERNRLRAVQNGVDIDKQTLDTLRVVLA